MATEEFKIKTQVELDTKDAQNKLQSFVENKGGKPLEVDVKLKNLETALDGDLKKLNKKISDKLEIKPESLQGFEKLDNALKNIETRLKGMKNLLNNGQINIFNMNGSDPKLFDDNLKSIENYVKKVEKGYEKIKKAKEEVENKPKKAEVIDLEKAENQAKKFANRIDALKLQFNNLKLKAVGIDNLDGINKQLDELKAKARESALNGLGTNTPELDRESKVLQQKYKLLQKIQNEYQKFEKFKLDMGDNIDENSLKEVDNLFRSIAQKVSAMDDLELDFNFDSFVTLLDNIKNQLKKDLTLDLDLSKSEESYLKFFNKLEMLKFELKNLSGLDVDIIGEENFKKLEHQIDHIKDKAGDSLSKGLSLNNSDVDLGYKNLKEQEKLLKRVQAEYLKFQDKKDLLKDIIGEDAVAKIEHTFKEAFAKISSMQNLELDFDLNKFFKNLRNIDDVYEIKVDTDKAEGQIDKFQNKLQELKYKFNNLDLDLIGEDNFNKIRNEIESIENETKNMLYGDSDKKLSDFDMNVKNLREQERLLKSVLSVYEKFNEKRDALGKLVDVESLNEVDNKFREVVSDITSMKNMKANFNVNDFFDSIKKVDKTFELEVDNSKAIEGLEKFENKLDVLRHNFNKLDLNIIGEDNINQIERRINEVFNKAKNNVANGMKIENHEVDGDLKVLREQLSLLKKVQSLYNNFDKARSSLSPDMDTSALKEIDNIFDDIIKKISSMKDLNSLDFNIDGFSNSINKANDSLRKMNTDFLGVKKIARDFKEEIASYTIGEMLGDAVTDFARGIGQSYMELDRSMREIKKVANPSDIDTKGELNAIRKEAIGIAKDVGMASSEVQRSIGSALQAGMGGMKESIEVAKQSMILANVGDMTQDSASKAINTVVKSFQLSPLKSYQLEVGNTVRKTTELKNAMDMMNFAG